VYGSTRVPDDIAAEEISMLTQLRDLKDLALNQCASPIGFVTPYPHVAVP
jgi:hypothetical protein